MTLRQRLYTYRRRARGRRKHPAFLTAALAAAAVLLIIHMLNMGIRPVIEEHIKSKINLLANTAINEVVLNQMRAGGVKYESLVSAEKNASGEIIALTTDVLALNSLKSDIILDVIEKLEGIGRTSFKIPSGSLTGYELLWGKGPGIPVSIAPVGSVEAEYSNIFVSAGLNQTRHQIMLNVKVGLVMSALNFKSECEVKTSVCIAETVIVGNVPDFYAGNAIN